MERPRRSSLFHDLPANRIGLAMPAHVRAARAPAPVRAPERRTATVRRLCNACDEEVVRRRAAPHEQVIGAPRSPGDFSLARIAIYSAEEVARRAAEPAAPIGLGGGPLPDGLGAYLARSAGSGRWPRSWSSS